MIFVNHRGHRTTPFVHKAPHHPAHAADMHRGRRTQYFTWQCDVELDRSARRKFGVHVQKYSAGRDVRGFRFVFVLLGLHLYCKLEGEADRTA